MSNRCQCARHSNASRVNERQGKRLDEGDFQGALGHRTVSPFVVNRIGFPPPTSYMEDGSKVWSF